MAKGIFVSGTDTDAGKTYFSVALLHALAKQGYSTLAMKPVAAGCDHNGHNDDAVNLQQTITAELAYEQLNPIALEAAIAPHIAAAQEGRTVHCDDLQRYAESLLARPEQWCLIEGAGGWLCPLNESETLADFAVALKLPVILVVGMKLGCLNHALLSVQAIRASGLTIAGWVANAVSETMPVREENIAYLEQAIGAPCIAKLPFGGSAEQAAQHIQLDFLAQL